MNEFDKYLEENELSFKNLLVYIDAYSIYCHYIGEDLSIGVKYSSPLRPKDDDPSFALYFSRDTDELMFKDHGNGKSGNALQFVKLLLGISHKNALLQINADFGLHFSNVETEGFKPLIVKRDLSKLRRDPVEIGITSKHYYSLAYWQYWKTLDIGVPILDLFYTKQVAKIHFTRGKKTIQVTPKSLCISYEINGFYKLYQPIGDPQYKFTNNYPYGYVEGGLQLRWEDCPHDFVVITKSTKECMFFRQHFDWDACAGTSENTMITAQFMQRLFASYRFVLIWLDNDLPGIRAQQKYDDKYPSIISINPMDKYIEKDPTDIYTVNQDNKKQALYDIETHVLSYVPK